MPAPALTSPALSERAVFSGAKRLLSEWLAYWFDGVAKPLGGSAATAWPTILPGAIRFDQDAPDRLDGVDLRVVVMQAGGSQGASGGPGAAEVATDRLAIQIWVRAGGAVPTAQGKGPADALQRVCEDLKAILGSPDSRAQLAGRGLTLHAARGPQTVENRDGPDLRLFTVTADADYEIA